MNDNLTNKFDENGIILDENGNAKTSFELLIIGAGPAGVSAALYAKSRGIDLAIIEKTRVGGLISTVSKVSHYTGLLGEENGQEFSSRLKKQLDDANIPVIKDEVLRLNNEDGLFSVQCKEKLSFIAKSVIIASGSKPKDLDIVDETKLVSHDAFSAKDKVKDKTVIICGGSDGAAKEAIFLSKLAKRVIMVQDQEQVLMINEFRQVIETSDNISVFTSSKLESLSLDNNKEKITAVQIRQGNELRTVEDDEILVFAFIGQVADLDYAAALLNRENGFANYPNSETDTKGLFVAGDCRLKAIKQIATAVSDGCEAAIKASNYILARRAK